MARPTGLQCNTSFPDDHVEDEEDITIPSGLALTKAVAELLSFGGIETSDPQMDLEHYSWIFDAHWRRAKFWIQVTHLDICYIHVCGGPWFLQRLFSRNLPRKFELADHIREILSSDPRFTEIRLFDVYKGRPV